MVLNQGVSTNFQGGLKYPFPTNTIPGFCPFSNHSTHFQCGKGGSQVCGNMRSVLDRHQFAWPKQALAPERKPFWWKRQKSRYTSFQALLCAVSCDVFHPEFRCQQLKSLKMSNYSLKCSALFLMNQATAFEIIGDRCLLDLTCWAHWGETILFTNTVTVKVISPLGTKAFMEATFIFKKSSIVAISSLLLLVQKSVFFLRKPLALLKIMVEAVLVLLTLYQIN